ncbi:MAG: family 10 glycosylhydrolase [Clostridia bacterium]|nr:family 10 glycosylhydrolase [Clostridia bacterium]
MKINKMDKQTLYIITAISAAFVVLFVAVTVVLALILKRDEPEDIPEPERAEISEMNGVWIATATNIDFPSRPDLSKAELKAELDHIVDTCADAGLDTIFYQVRPASDAMYDSVLYPVSRYLSTDGELTLDTLEYLIEAAREKGINVHAWINPLRAAVSGDVDDLAPDHPERKNPDWTVKYADGKTYYDCAIPEVRKLVCDGIAELIEKYDIAGIVFDDYFYPYPVYETDSEGNKTIAPFDDDGTYSKYGKDFDDKGDWRRDNVNKLIKECYNTVKTYDEDCLFGVAPFGIWKNGYGDESGSTTRGAQSYSDIYCDTIAWVKGGYVDYIAPQIYWRTEETAASYDAICDWWDYMLGDTDIPFFVCHGAYRYEDWESPAGIMTDQVEYAKEKETYKGSIFYGFEEIESNKDGIRDELKELYKKAVAD